MNRIDLTQARDYYIKNNCTYKDLALLYNVSSETIRKRAYKENWKQARNDYKASLVNKVVETDSNADISNIHTLKDIRYKTLYKLIKLLNKSADAVLPTDTTTIRTLASAFSDLSKILSDLDNNNKDNELDKLDTYLEALWIDAGVPLDKWSDKNYNLNDFIETKKNNNNN